MHRAWNALVPVSSIYFSAVECKIHLRGKERGMRGNKGNKVNRKELGKIEKMKIKIKIEIVKKSLSTWGVEERAEKPAARESGLPVAAGWDCNGTNSAAL